MDLYAENILEHYHNPRHYGQLNAPTVSFEDSNPLCGDIIRLTLHINNNKLEDAKFSGEGCAISQASASMLLDEIIGKDVSFIKEISNEYIYDLLGVPLSPARVKCALLSLAALKKALHSYDM